MANEYNDSSIRSLKGEDRVRDKPSVMFGSDDVKGAFHTVKEILANCLDEVRAGYGSYIRVIRHKDMSITIIDEGRGVPMDWNEDEERFNWDLVFNELYAGGKYDDEGSYNESLGTNGLGAASTQYTSEYFHVESMREDFIYRKSFEKGQPVGELEKVPNETGKTGTKINWKIDNEVFHDTNFRTEMFINLLESQAHINSIVIEYVDEKNDKTHRFEGLGIVKYLEQTLGSSVIEVLTKEGRDSGTENNKKYKARAEIVLAITDGSKHRHMHFNNTSIMTEGVHERAFNEGVKKFFRDIGKAEGLNIENADYRDYLSVLTSTYANPNALSFANQTKDGVSNLFMYWLIHDTVVELLEEAQMMQKESISTLIENVLIVARARKKAKELEDQLRDVEKLTKDKKNTSEKFTDCASTDPAEKELYITEGDSANGSIKKARNRRFQALMPIRGKIINALKHPLPKVLSNKEVQYIINAIGAGIDIGGGLSSEDTFDIEKAKFHKIIIATDADEDGSQIQVLLFCFFYRFMPKLIEAGYLYIVESPLFEIELVGKESVVAYDLEEKDAIVAQLKKEGKKIKRIKRAKGLGQNNKELLARTTMNPETRRLVPLTMDFKQELVQDTISMLFGKDVNRERKSFIISMLEEQLGEEAKNLEELKEMVDALSDDELDTIEAEMEEMKQIQELQGA